jgi:diguanylate cyclase (GGDEF)-like protein
MTGLANREHFHQQINKACHEAEVNRQSFGVLYIDLDRFKPINDAYGHEAGNFVLLAFSKRLREKVPPGSRVGRLGGDEFAILSAPFASKLELDELAHIALDAAQAPFQFGEIELAVSASIGISVFPENGSSMPELLRSADAAMYRSKQDGRNSFCYADGASPSTQSTIVHQLTLEVALHRALMENELFLEYQPIFDSFRGEMVGVEALLRWRRADGEMVRPDVFIPIAEKSRLIVKMGRWVLRQACRDLATLHQSGFSDLCMNVNMAVAEFTSQDLARELMEVTRACGLRPHDLCLEITEGMVMQHADSVIPVMQALRKQGFRISLDDFGMGHSSLSRLKSLPISVLKIDRSFIRGLPQQTQDCAIVRTIFDLAWHMNLQIVAEGVETDAQLSYLSQFGYPMIQGFLLGRPMPLVTLIASFNDKRWRTT